MKLGPYLILIALGGLLVSVLARQVVSRAGSMSIVQTCLVGVAGALLAGLIGWYAIHSRIAGFVLATLVTIAMVYSTRPVSSSASGRQAGSADRPARPL